MGSLFRRVASPEAWARLIEPGPAVEGEGARRRARYTALSIVVIVPLILVAFALELASGPSATTGGVLGGAALLLAVLFPLSRGRHFAIASYLAIGVTSTAIWISWHASHETVEGVILFFLAIPLIMGGVLLSPVGAGVISLANLAFVGITTTHEIVTGEARASYALAVPLFIVLVGGLVVNAARLRERDLASLEALASRLRAEEATRRQMLNNIAHDLGSPLTPIKLQVRLIPADKPVPPERVALLQRNVAQMERLVLDLKDLARLQAGGFRMDPRPMDLRDAATGVFEAFRAEAEQKGRDLQVHVGGALPVHADAQRITQVLYNLVTNAIKFTPQGGRIAVHAEASEGRALVRVRDTGRGLTADEMARLFQPFSQVHDRAEVAERGTGLGLYISRGIAEAHGGGLDVASEGRGAGSTFTLALPLAPST